MSTFFTIQSGELVNKAIVKKAFDLKDGVYELEIKKRDKRSLQQNRYYFGVCIKMIRDELYERGNDVSIQETHEWINSKFNYLEVINEETGEVERIPQSTTKLNKEGFGLYIEKVQRFGAEFLSITIPDPGEQMMLNYE